MESKKIPNLNEDTIRRIVVEPKNETFPVIEKIVKTFNEREDNLKIAIELLKKCAAFIDRVSEITRFHLGEDIDDSDLEKQITKFLQKVKKT